MQLSEVVPWGRSFDEYCQMFALDAADLQKSILGCADGPASFNAELNQRGGQVLSVDPLYQYSAEQIAQRIEVTAELVLEQVEQHQQDFVWEQLTSVAQLAGIRREAMNNFLADFPAGQAAGRYLSAELPQLPFADQSFDLALCAHFLFLYAGQLSFVFHQRALLELLRVAGEVRVFPLVELDNKSSRHLSLVMETFQLLGFQTNLQTVNYQFQRGGNKMLKITRFNYPV